MAPDRSRQIMIGRVGHFLPPILELYSKRLIRKEIDPDPVAPIIVSAACQVHRKSPDVVWVAPELEPLIEDGKNEAETSRGLFGSLIHP